MLAQAADHSNYVGRIDRWPTVAKSDHERAARQAHRQQAASDFDALPFGASAVRSLGRVATSLGQSGRKAQTRAYGAMIAATALANALPTYIRNPDAFSGIDGLDVVAVSVPNRL